METHAVTKYRLVKFWDDSFKSLEYIHEPFNDTAQLMIWRGQGFADRFTGAMCDMRSQQPSWNDQFIKIYENLGWKDIGTSYYRMGAGTILPTHGDLYKKYIELWKVLVLWELEM